MPSLPTYKVIGPTQGFVSVIATTSMVVKVTGAAQFNHAAFLNVGPAPICISISQLTVNLPRAVFPTTGGVPVNGFVIPPAMTLPMVIAVPANGFSLSAISNSTVPSQLYVCPMGE